MIKKTFPFFLLSIAILYPACKQKMPNPEQFNAELSTSWNQLIMKTAIAEDGLLTLKGVRTAAMMHVATHDALNAIQPVFSSYAFSLHTPTANPAAAAAQAAFEVAVNQYPDQKKAFEWELNKWLSPLQKAPGFEEGIKLGKSSASAILNKRLNDRWNEKADYTWHPMGPGVYAEFNEHSGTPEGFIFGAGWAAAQPFLLTSQDQFRSPPPPEISSDDYTQAYNEVKSVGAYNSTTRTTDQSHLAMWWKDFVENSHNRLARELVTLEKLNLWESSRLFALLNMTICDAYINVFNNKFYYNHWRPYTAIRWAANDGNPNTEPDTSWNNLHQHTYAFPSYPSAHGTASSAAMTILANTLGKGDNYSFIMTTEEVDQAGPFSKKVKMQPPTRSFRNFREAGLEASMSRVYLGIHFRYDSEQGHLLGNQIGAFASQNFLQPLQ